MARLKGGKRDGGEGGGGRGGGREKRESFRIDFWTKPIVKFLLLHYIYIV